MLFIKTDEMRVATNKKLTKKKNDFAMTVNPVDDSVRHIFKLFAIQLSWSDVICVI